MEKYNNDVVYWVALRNAYINQNKMGQLYQPNSRIAPTLIVFFYNLFPHPFFDLGLKSFKTKYIINETETEQNKLTERHSQCELIGMAEMYKYIEHYEFAPDGFTLFEVKELHRKLYTHAPHPEFAGDFRNGAALITALGVEPTPAEQIIYEIFELSDQFDIIVNTPIENSDDLINYIRACVILTTKLLKIHPFNDGNGRSIRGLLNLMFKKVNIPPVYVTPNEREIYLKALKKAQLNNEYNKSDYEDIIGFYYYKICDSLIEITNDILLKETKSNQPNNTNDVKLT